MITALDIALIQLRAPDNQAAALAQAAPLVRQAAAGGAKLILTPEVTNLVEPRLDERMRKLTTADRDAAILGLRALAEELDVWLLIGSAVVLSQTSDEPRQHNRSFLVGPDGEIRAVYDKIHLYDVDLATGESHRESSRIQPGRRAVVAETPWGGLGLSVCYDVRFPQLYRALARGGARMIAVPAAFTVPTGEAHWELLVRMRAVETGCFVLAPAQGGAHTEDRRSWGRSMVAGPWGEVVARLDHDEPGVLFASLDLSKVGAARAAIPQLFHDRAFEDPAPVSR